MFERVFVDHGLSGGTLVSEVAGGTKPIPDLSLLYREIDYDTVEKEQWLSQVRQERISAEERRKRDLAEAEELLQRSSHIGLSSSGTWTRETEAGSMRSGGESAWTQHVKNFEGTSASALLAEVRKDIERVGLRAMKKHAYVDSGREGRIRRGVCDEGHRVLNALHPEVDAIMNARAARRTRESTRIYGLDDGEGRTRWSGEDERLKAAPGAREIPDRPKKWDDERIDREAKQREWRAVGGEALDLLSSRHPEVARERDERRSRALAASVAASLRAAPERGMERPAGKSWLESFDEISRG